MNLIRNVLTSPAAPASALLFGNLLLYQPAQVYKGNEQFFSFSFLQSGLPLFVLFLACFVLFALPALGKATRKRARYVAGLTALGIISWISATFFPGTKGLLDGLSFALITDVAYLWGNVAVLSLSAAAAFWLALRFSGHARRFVMALGALFAAYLVITVVTDTNSWKRNLGDAEKLTSFSSERNVLVLLLDTFQSDFFEEIIQKDPSIKSQFEGFTYYRNAVGHSPTTYLAIPSIMSGNVYTKGASINAFYKTGVVHGSFITRLVDAGFDGVVVNPAGKYCPQGAFCTGSEEISKGILTSVLLQSAHLLDISILRAVPHSLKHWIYNNGRWRVYGLAINAAKTKKTEALDDLDLRVRWAKRTESDLLGILPKKMTTTANRPTVKFLHFFISHPPAQLDGRCNEVSGRQWTKGNAIDQARCGIGLVTDVLEALREHNIYDQTAVLVLADHGSGISGGESFRQGASASPLLLVKPFDSRHAFVVSQAIVGLVDVPATVCDLTRACSFRNGLSVFGVTPQTKRAFIFNEYKWTKENKWGHPVEMVATYRIDGRPSDIRSWHRILDGPLPEIQSLSFAQTDAPELYGLGWSFFESDDQSTWLWAIGSQASIYLGLPEEREYVLSFRVTTHARNAGQMLAAYANGVYLGDRQINAGEWQDVEFTIKEGGGPAPIQLEFRFSKWNSPGTQDERSLAVLFDEAVIR